MIRLAILSVAAVVMATLETAIGPISVGHGVALIIWALAVVSQKELD